MPHDTSTNYGVAEGGAKVTLDETKTILLVGVGGQGTILAGQLLAMVAADAGLDVKVSEIHGMSQRGGSVSTIVRVGPEVQSMICDPGCADIVVAFEAIEALRAQQFVREGGSLFVNDETIVPVPVNIGNPGEFTIRELAEQVIDITGSSSRIVYEPLPGDDPKQRRPDISLAHEKLGWEPLVPLREGLIKTIGYFDGMLRSMRHTAVIGQG